MRYYPIYSGEVISWRAGTCNALYAASIITINNIDSAKPHIGLSSNDNAAQNARGARTRRSGATLSEGVTRQ